MPSPQKVSWSKLRVGITALVAMAIIGTLIFLLTTSGNIFKRKLHLRMYMDDASGTSESAPVRLNGIPVGNVKKIELSGSTRTRNAPSSSSWRSRENTRTTFRTIPSP